MNELSGSLWLPLPRETSSRSWVLVVWCSPVRGSGSLFPSPGCKGPTSPPCRSSAPAINITLQPSLPCTASAQRYQESSRALPRDVPSTQYRRNPAGQFGTHLPQPLTENCRGWDWPSLRGRSLAPVHHPGPVVPPTAPCPLAFPVIQPTQRRWCPTRCSHTAALIPIGSPSMIAGPPPKLPNPNVPNPLSICGSPRSRR